jgi:hypothetical protein
MNGKGDKDRTNDIKRYQENYDRIFSNSSCITTGRRAKPRQSIQKQSEIKTKEYEVEKITTTAGVRGNEATDEILDYLYYRVRDNKLQIPTKLAEKLNI